jgi:uncharacterized protein (DUF427 family)
MVKAIWNGEVLAESDRTIVVEGNHYFPPEAINKEFFTESERHTVCGWKGIASYYNVNVNDQVNMNAAWYYPTPNDAVRKIAGYIAFWHGVQVREE